MAQEESRSLSENVKWGVTAKFERGEFTLPYKQFLGYEKGPDGKPKIVEEQAEIVRRIYKEFLSGKTPNAIAKGLMADGILSPAGKEKWQASTVKSILSNEKYCGQALLRKQYTADFLNKIRKKNNGTLPQYYIDDSHEGIISLEVYQLTKMELEKRKQNTSNGNSNIFSSKLVCNDCHSFYGAKVWHSNDKYRKVIYRCNHKYKDDDSKCSSATLSEEEIMAAFVKAFNLLISGENNIDDIKMSASILTNIEELKIEKEQLESTLDVNGNQLEHLANELSKGDKNIIEYQKQYNEMAVKYKSAQAKLNEVNSLIQERTQKKCKIDAFLKAYEKQNTALKEFDATPWSTLLDEALVGSDYITFVFRNGKEIKVNI